MTGSLDELEAVIWERLTAMTCHRITQGDFVDAILHAACGYAVRHAATLAGRNVIREQAEIPRRRAELEAERRGYRHAPPPVHFLGGTPGEAACRPGISSPVLAVRPEDVKCGACKRTRAWKAAA